MAITECSGFVLIRTIVQFPPLRSQTVPPVTSRLGWGSWRDMRGSNICIRMCGPSRLCKSFSLIPLKAFAGPESPPPSSGKSRGTTGLEKAVRDRWEVLVLDMCFQIPSSTFSSRELVGLHLVRVSIDGIECPALFGAEIAL